MAGLVCNFCAHGNPEGSKFCNECGSPLNLTLCSVCEAINSTSATRCYQCGGPLSSGPTAEMAIPPTVPTEDAQSAERAPTKADPVPIALAEAMNPFLEGPRVMAHEPRAAMEDSPSRTLALSADPVSHGDDGPLSPTDNGRSTYPGRDVNRARGFILVAVIVAVAGGLYWISMDSTRPPDSGSVTRDTRDTAPVPASATSAAPARTADTSDQSRTEATGGESISPSAEAGPSPGASTKSPATVGESIAPHADVTPSAAGQAPESVKAQVAPQAKAAESLNGETAKTTNAGAASDPRRSITKGRTKEQAEQDASATRRLIERDLANSPSTDSRAKPPPGP
jgi:double zinc ribbon protein